MTSEELWTAIQADAKAAAHAAVGDDVQCAARMTEILPHVKTPVPNRDVKRHAILGGYIAGVTMGSEVTNPNKLVRGLCISVIAWINDTEATTDFTLPEVDAMLDGLVAAGLMTSEQRASLEALALRPQVITANEVSAAMRPSRETI